MYLQKYIMDTGILTMNWKANAVALFNTVAFELYSVGCSIFIVLEKIKYIGPWELYVV